ncbi:HOG (high osmolarity glycerol) pathway protein [Mortierella sp. AD094]|nr:HOG (high osmolarity glycerol) pathway protein [Mortierella sp. AD094]
MIMAPVSLPPCQTLSTVRNTTNMEAYLNKKRTSVHYPDDSTVAKRMSLHLGPRCRSLSESWAFTSASTVLPEFSEKQTPQPSTPLSNVITATISEVSTSSSTSSLSSLSSDNTSSASSDKTEEQPDPELLKTLASFLRGEGNAADSHSTANDCRTIKGNKSALNENTTSTELSQSAGPTNEESTTCDLVITVRDFAYPKTHPYHRGFYPPEPVYEESDVEEDDYMDELEDKDQEQDDEEDRTQGYARGLYDFDAENSSELSFREGENLWIHYRQFPGWFLGEMDGKTGLVPENYVQLL